MKNKFYAIVMLTLAFVYPSVVALFIITKNDIILDMWEIITVISGVYFLFFFNYYLKINCIEKNKNLIIGFLIAMMVLTSINHLASVFITRPLIKSGYNIPFYYVIGMWPSYMMLIDYVAWGFLLGLIFILIGLSIKDNKKLFYLFLISGLLCLLGFIGGLTPIQELWYIAPCAYVVAPLILAINLLKKAG